MQSPEAQLESLNKEPPRSSMKPSCWRSSALAVRSTSKLGVDPTAPDIHLGFTVALTKLRQFQDLGHQAILIIGDFTAMIGDPSGRSKTRPQLTHDQVMANAHSFQRRPYKILDPCHTRTVFNGQWFEMMTFEEVMKLNSRVTHAANAAARRFQETHRRAAKRFICTKSNTRSCRAGIR